MTSTDDGLDDDCDSATDDDVVDDDDDRNKAGSLFWVAFQWQIDVLCWRCFSGQKIRQRS